MGLHKGQKTSKPCQTHAQVGFSMAYITYIYIYMTNVTVACNTASPQQGLLSTIWTRAALSPFYSLGGESWFTATHKSGLVQNNQPRFLGLKTLLFFSSFFLKQKHVLIYDTIFCRFTLTLMNCLCKNKSFIPAWILFRWLQGNSNYFNWNDLSFQTAGECNWKLKAVKTKEDGWFLLIKFFDSKWILFQCFNNDF